MMESKDWIPVVAALVSFVGGLLGAGMGAFFSGRTERLKLLRTERVKACSDLMTACRSAVRSWDMWRRHEFAENNPSQIKDPEWLEEEKKARMVAVAEELAKAQGDAWNAYHRTRLLGPKEIVEATQQYWKVYEKLVRSELGPDKSLDFDSLRAAEETFCAEASKHLVK